MNRIDCLTVGLRSAMSPERVLRRWPTAPVSILFLAFQPLQKFIQSNQKCETKYSSFEFKSIKSNFLVIFVNFKAKNCKKMSNFFNVSSSNQSDQFIYYF